MSGVPSISRSHGPRTHRIGVRARLPHSRARQDDQGVSDVRARAEPFFRSPVHLGDLALAFDATTAATARRSSPAPATSERGASSASSEVDVRVNSHEFAARFDERFSAPAEAVSTPGSAPDGIGPRLEAAPFAALSPLL
jgi:hypothetical protein